MTCDKLSWTGEKCERPQEECGNMEWGQFISLHKMPSKYSYGYEDRPRDMPVD